MYSQLKTELRCLKDLTKHPNDSVWNEKTECNCSTRLLFSVRPHNFHKEHQYFEGTWPGYHKIHWWITLFSSIVSAKLSIHWKPIPFFQPSCKSGMEIRSCMQTAPSNMKKPRDTYLVICSRFPDQSKRKAEVILATGATSDEKIFLRPYFQEALSATHLLKAYSFNHLLPIQFKIPERTIARSVPSWRNRACIRWIIYVVGKLRKMWTLADETLKQTWSKKTICGTSVPSPRRQCCKQNECSFS